MTSWPSMTIVEHEFGAWLGQLASNAKKVSGPVRITNAPLVPTPALLTNTGLPIVFKLL